MPASPQNKLLHNNSVSSPENNIRTLKTKHSFKNSFYALGHKNELDFQLPFNAAPSGRQYSISQMHKKTKTSCRQWQALLVLCRTLTVTECSFMLKVCS